MTRPPDATGNETVASFEISYRRLLDPSGAAVGDLPDFARNADELKSLYRAMVLTRTYDGKAVALQRTGRLGTYASVLGEEATNVGLAAAMEPADILVPTYREPGAQLWRGVTMVELLLVWGGDERGHDFAGPRRDFPICIPVGSQAPHAAGAGLALKLRGEKQAVACVMGDGATSKGDVYEAMNIAGAWHLPVVFFIVNNQWAISVPRAAQTAAETLAQKAIAAGIPAEQVDGNDVIAVREACAAALAKARAGGGPHVIEAITYRMGDHTTADDARRYRDDKEVSAYWSEDPIARLRQFLVSEGAWTKEEEEDLLADCAKRVEEAVEAYLATPPEPPEAMFDHLYEKLPDAFAGQRTAAREQANGDD